MRFANRFLLGLLWSATVYGVATCADSKDSKPHAQDVECHQANLGTLHATGGHPSSAKPAETNLERLLRISERIYVGGQPEGDAAYGELVQLGVQTLVSVDGIRPDVDAARRHGLRYVHIPIGYDGVDLHAGRSLVQLSRTVEGPMFVHCHHGVHRGPAAAAILAMADGATDAAGAMAILARAGTRSRLPWPLA